MRGRVWLLLCLVLVGGASGFAWSWRQRFAGPVIAVPETVDLGIRDLGEWLTFPIAVQNAGTEPLHLSRFKTSCGCLTVATRSGGASVPVVELTVAPGETVPLWTGLVTRGKAGERLREEIRFETNDPKRPVVVVVMTVLMQGAVVAVPPRLELNSLRMGEVRESRLLIYDIGRKKPFRLAEVRSTAPERVSVLRSTLLPPGENEPAGLPGTVSRYAVDVRITAPSRPGDFDARLEIFDEGDPVPVLTVPTGGMVVPRFQLSPAAVLLPRRSTGGLLYHAKCVCRSPTDESFDLTVLSAPAGVKAVVRRQTRSSYLVEIVASPVAGKEMEGKVTLQAVSGSDKETLDLRVHVAPPDRLAP